MFRLKVIDINAKTRVSEENYFKTKLDNLSHNPTKFWRELNLLLGRQGTEKPEVILNDHRSGKELRGDLVPGYINDFFSNIGGELFNKLGDAPVVSHNKQPSCEFHIATEESEVGYSEVLKLLKDIQVHKSSGIADINTAVLKDALLLMAPQLTELINMCLHRIKFPTLLRWYHYQSLVILST